MLRPSFFAACALLSVGAAGLVASCSGDNTIAGVAPVAGIVVRSESLISGRGCGRGDDQIFKYAAVLTTDPDAGGTFIPGGTLVVDCFTDAVFANLSATTATFGIAIYAFDANTYDPNAADIANAVAAANNVASPSDPTSTLSGAATWMTTCTATQQSTIQVLANCQPLAPVRGPTRIRIPTMSFARGDAGATYTCTSDFTNVTGVYVATNADAGDGAPPQAGITGAVMCPNPLDIPAKGGDAYQIDVQLEGLLQPSDSDAGGDAAADAASDGSSDGAPDAPADAAADAMADAATNTDASADAGAGDAAPPVLATVAVARCTATGIDGRTVYASCQPAAPTH